jgi:putative transposase
VVARGVSSPSAKGAGQRAARRGGREGGNAAKDARVDFCKWICCWCTWPGNGECEPRGIAFEGSTYIDPTLAAYIGEEVQIRYDPLDLAELRVYFEDRFVCRAICPELSGQTVSLKEIEAARRARRKHLRGELESRETLVKQYVKESMRSGRAEEKGAQEPGQEERVTSLSAASQEQEAGMAPKRLRRYRDE